MKSLKNKNFKYKVHINYIIKKMNKKIIGKKQTCFILF